MNLDTVGRYEGIRIRFHIIVKWACCLLGYNMKGNVDAGRMAVSLYFHSCLVYESNPQALNL